MGLELFNQLANKLERNEGVQKFINELGNFLKNVVEGNISSMSVLDRVERENNVSLVSKNKMRNQKQEILKKYAKETENAGELYLVTKKRNEEGTYRVEQYTKDDMEVVNLQLPQDTLIDSVLREKGGEYILDENATKDVTEELEKMAEEILNAQEEELQDYRQEGHIYLVTEDTSGRIYLSDQTESRGYEIEEVDFPNELKGEVAEGTMLQYENGSYQICEE